MLSDAELAKLRQFIAEQRKRDTSPLERLWAGRCEALLEQMKQLEQQVEGLTREIGGTPESGATDTWDE